MTGDSRGRLILCGTPIGNLEDMTWRAVRTLREADVLACEDVGRTRKLLAHFEIPSPRLLVLNEGNERSRSGELVARVNDGQNVVVVSGAGMPGFSDPGYRVVKACAEAGLRVEVVPGPTAAVSALIVSGLASDRFVFEGFLPRAAGPRRRRIAELADESRTLVIYESPHRLKATLNDLVATLGDRPAALVRELTKVHEEVLRASLSSLLDEFGARPARGELVLVIAGADNPPQEVPAIDLARRATELMGAGVARGEALRQVAKEAGVARRDVFDALVREGAE
ncbi:MAG: 16S rRNA (cytidine(1402)-2'-O)-methyltransferase [Actinomycetota bacterium]|nr:16S rRNA (cytidine(1402)-2'-O)-methyltransferase [Actinomycetota bacterium]